MVSFENWRHLMTPETLQSEGKESLTGTKWALQDRSHSDFLAGMLLVNELCFH